MLDPAGQTPAGDVHRIGIWIHQLDVFLVLVVGSRIVLKVAEMDGSVFRLRSRDAWVAANRYARRIDDIVSVVELRPPGREVTLERVDR